MMPLIALVTLMSGVCSAGVTFQIDVPADDAGQQEHGQVLDELGRPEDRRRRPAGSPPAPPSTLRAAARRPAGVGAPPWRVRLAGCRRRGAAARAAAGCGGGHISSPSLRTSAPRWISSFEVDDQPLLGRDISLSRLQHGRRVELARLARHAARQIGEADDA